MRVCNVIYVCDVRVCKACLYALMYVLYVMYVRDACSICIHVRNVNICMYMCVCMFACIVCT